MTSGVLEEQDCSDTEIEMTTLVEDFSEDTQNVAEIGGIFFYQNSFYTISYNLIHMFLCSNFFSVNFKIPNLKLCF